MTDALKDEFPDPETELAFLEFLATEWPNWRHHVGSDHWHIRRRSFLAGRSAPQALAATPAVGGVSPSDDDWQRALDCAMSCMKPPFHISRSTMDNAMQHAFGILVLGTPAVGGEPVAWLYEMAFAIKPSADPAFTKWKQVVTLDPPPTIPKDGVRNVSPLFAAQPASPLRGREPDPKAPWRCVNCGNDLAKCACAVDPFFECPNCGKDIADSDEPHAVDCSSAPSPEQPEFQRTNPLDTRLSPIEPFTGNYKGTKE